MKAIIQRVKVASVMVEGKLISQIGKGILVFLGIERDDKTEDADYIAKKIINMRIFEDSSGKMNLSIRDINGEIMVVSEFTLAGNCRKGNRPSFDNAMAPEEAQKIYNYFIENLKKSGLPIKEGSFRSFMHVSLINEGPATFILDTR